jgi:hypothetical protein
VRYFLWRTLLYLSTVLAGGAVFWGISWGVGLVFPAAAFWVFCALFAWWAWAGWKYATLADEVRRREGRDIRQRDIWGQSGHLNPIRMPHPSAAYRLRAASARRAVRPSPSVLTPAALHVTPRDCRRADQPSPSSGPALFTLDPRACGPTGFAQRPPVELSGLHPRSSRQRSYTSRHATAVERTSRRASGPYAARPASARRAFRSLHPRSSRQAHAPRPRARRLTASRQTVMDRAARLTSLDLAPAPAPATGRPGSCLSTSGQDGQRQRQHPQPGGRARPQPSVHAPSARRQRAADRPPGMASNTRLRKTRASVKRRQARTLPTAR